MEENRVGKLAAMPAVTVVLQGSPLESRAEEAIEEGREAAREGKKRGGIRGALDYWQGKSLGRVGRKMQRNMRR